MPSFLLDKACGILVLLSVVSFNLRGQTTPTPKVHVERFSIEEGLSDRKVNSIVKDKQGFLWLATDNGLNRFDGYSFLNYDTRPRSKHKIRHAKVYAVLPDRAGNLLLCYNDPDKITVDLLNPLSGQLITFPSDSTTGSKGSYRAFFQAPDGTLYFHALEQTAVVVYQFDEETLHFNKVLETSPVGNNPNCFVSFLRAADGTFWFAYNWEILDVVVIHTDANGKTIRSFTASDFHLRAGSTQGKVFLAETSNAEILFTLEHHGVFKMNQKGNASVTRYELLPPNDYLFRNDTMGNLLAYLLAPKDPLHGCYLITAENDVIDYNWIFEHQALITDVYSVNFTQGLFAGTGDGFNNYRLRPEIFHTYLDKDMGNAPYGISMRGMIRLGDKVYFATEFDGLFELDLNTNDVSRPGDRAPQLSPLNTLMYPRNMLVQDDHLWISAKGGLYKFVPETNTLGFIKTFTGEEPTAEDEVWGITFGKDGNIWAVSRDGRVLLLDAMSSMLTIYLNSDGTQPLNTQPSCIISDTDGFIWIGTTLGGLIRIDPLQKITSRYTADPSDPAGFNSNHITCIHEDKAGFLWIGTMEGGLHVFDPSRGIVTDIYSRENGLRNNSVVGILPDDKGNYWVSTFSGLAYFDTQLKTFRNFTTADGLSHNEFNRHSSFFDKDAGRFYFGGMNGVIAFDQRDPRTPDNNAPLLISQLSVTKANGQTSVQHEGITDGSTITLEPGSRLLQLQLALGTYLEPEANQFSYKIEGLDNEWRFLGSNRELRIDRLPTGTYVLMLRGADNRGNWSSNEIALHLIVQEYWYKSWWAYLIYALLLIGVSWYFYRFKLHQRLVEKEAQRLQQLDVFKTRFFTNISHEFRTPLTVIIGMVESMKKHFNKSAASEHEQAAEMIRRNSRQVLNLVNQLLELSRLESGKLELTLSNGDIVSFLQYQIESFTSFAETRHIKLHFESGVPHLEMAFDHEKVQTILVNLISNAIKFTPEGGDITLKLMTNQTQNTSISSSNTPASIVIALSDTGIGMDQDQAHKVFDRFYQVDDSMTRKSEGTGIGLALVHELVKLMHGTASVESRQGKGTTFTITLPYVSPSPDLKQFTGDHHTHLMPEETDTLLPVEAGTDDERPLLLIVEDNADVRFYIAECVRDDYRIETAGNGAEGITKAISLVPDIIISDVMMPEKDGFDLCETLKNDPVTSHIPIVLLTARADFESRITGLKRGADDYLAKPFEPVELNVRLENLVRIRRLLQRRFAVVPLEPATHEADPALILEDAFLLKFREMVESHMSDSDFDMPSLEQALGMSRSQVYRKVKALTGGSPTVLIRSIRLHKAKELLANKALTISEVAYEVGFSSPAYFSTTFLEEFGQSPSDFRQG